MKTFPFPAIVMLPRLHGKPLGKRRTTLIRKRVIVFGKHEQWMHFWASALTTVWAPHVTALGDAATEPVVIVSQGLIWGKCLEIQRDFSERKMRLIVMRVSMISLFLCK